ncbi:MAG: hypothetical protein QNL62_20590 [Gammaproteobacteria bacterium]|nr:hypothetical protein [Gammaproteobacteria bacterium]
MFKNMKVKFIAHAAMPNVPTPIIAAKLKEMQDSTPKWIWKQLSADFIAMGVVQVTSNAGHFETDDLSYEFGELFLWFQNTVLEANFEKYNKFDEVPWA